MSPSTERNIPVSAVAGALGGLTASFVMNQFQAELAKVESVKTDNKQLKPAGDDATVKMADAVSRYTLGRRLMPSEKKWAGPAVHYSFGALLGAVYGVLAATVPTARAGTGTAYGSAVWLLADEVFVPGFGLSDSSRNFPLSFHAKALASHLVYGATTDLTRKLLLKVAARA
jgi:putative membrane protein